MDMIGYQKFIFYGNITFNQQNYVVKSDFNLSILVVLNTLLNTTWYVLVQYSIA